MDDKSQAHREADHWGQFLRKLCPGGATDVVARAGGGESGERVLDTLRFLGFFDAQPPAVNKSSPDVRHAFCNLLEKKLAYGPNERDMVLMRHEFGVKLPSGLRQIRESSYVGFGGGSPTSFTCMANTVGITCAIGAQLILNGTIHKPGVLLPTAKEVYLPGLQRLASEGFTFTETSRDL
jgi:saccharopine dehydrogenase-like NADP-dependent oxidoreductase